MSDSIYQTNFLKISPRDGKDCVINENFIRFVIKDNNCFNVCSKMTGCNEGNMIKVCKHDAFETWNKLNKLFS
jgi:hypothetical protein